MCTFGTTPSELGKAYLSREEVLEIARAGERAGCREALFTLGDRPEARYAAARDALTQRGHDSTLSYLGDMARAVLEETRSEEHTSELQSLMRNTYAVFCLKTKTIKNYVYYK